MQACSSQADAQRTWAEASRQSAFGYLCPRSNDPKHKMQQIISWPILEQTEYLDTYAENETGDTRLNLSLISDLTWP